VNVLFSHSLLAVSSGAIETWKLTGKVKDFHGFSSADDPFLLSMLIILLPRKEGEPLRLRPYGAIQICLLLLLLATLWGYVMCCVVGTYQQCCRWLQ